MCTYSMLPGCGYTQVVVLFAMLDTFHLSFNVYPALPLLYSYYWSRGNHAVLLYSAATYDAI